MEIASTSDPCISSSTTCDDLLIEILVRLPLKSLARFKCVSKSWNGLISSDHLRRRVPLITSGVFFHETHDEPRYASTSDDDVRLEDCDLGFFPCQKTSTIIDGCNGLLLYYTSQPMMFHVVNPTTKSWATLPKPKKKTLLSILAFDPFNSPHYKVVCFTAWRVQGMDIEVFTSETGKWTDHELQLGLDTDAISATMHYFDGVLYILAYSGHVVTIDLENMACNLIELPASAMSCKARLGHCSGCLHYCCTDGDKLKIWMLKDVDACAWTLKGVVDVNEIAEQSAVLCKVNFLAFHPERDVVYLWVPGRQLVSYDLQGQRIEREWKFASEKEGAYLIQVWLFPFSRYLSDCLSHA